MRNSWYKFNWSADGGFVEIQTVVTRDLICYKQLKQHRSDLTDHVIKAGVSHWDISILISKLGSLNSLHMNQPIDK